MLSFIGFLFYFCRRSRHCRYCGDLGIKSQMVRGSHGTYFCDAACKASRSAQTLIEMPRRIG